jgi:hypothetical protein
MKMLQRGAKTATLFWYVENGVREAENQPTNDDAIRGIATVGARHVVPLLRISGPPWSFVRKSD